MGSSTQSENFFLWAFLLTRSTPSPFDEMESTWWCGPCRLFQQRLVAALVPAKGKKLEPIQLEAPDTPIEICRALLLAACS